MRELEELDVFKRELGEIGDGGLNKLSRLLLLHHFGAQLLPIEVHDNGDPVLGVARTSGVRDKLHPLHRVQATWRDVGWGLVSDDTRALLVMDQGFLTKEQGCAGLALKLDLLQQVLLKVRRRPDHQT